MIKYKITDRVQRGEYIDTTVEYTIGEEKVVVVVPHFKPTDEQDVLTGISNRGISEAQKLADLKAAEANNAQIMSALADHVDKVVTIPQPEE